MASLQKYSLTLLINTTRSSAIRLYKVFSSLFGCSSCQSSSFFNSERWKILHNRTIAKEKPDHNMAINNLPLKRAPPKENYEKSGLSLKPTTTNWSLLEEALLPSCSMTSTKDEPWRIHRNPPNHYQMLTFRLGKRIVPSFNRLCDPPLQQSEVLI